MKHINKTPGQYQQEIARNQPPEQKLAKIIRAFVVGGLICGLGQALNNLFAARGLTATDAGALSTITLIFLGGLFTGLGVYDRLGQFAGAGSMVPVTGFANAMVAPALEFKQEGLVTGMGAKLFNVAGPVLTFGMVSAFIIGLLSMVLGG
ncbi:MAG: stage V sporulation protein AC [Bacillota bacterium]